MSNANAATTHEHGNQESCAHMRVNSYSAVGVIEQKDVVNSGARGTKDRNPGIEVDWYSTLIRVEYQSSTLSHSST
jgi:hypothetical protein